MDLNELFDNANHWALHKFEDDKFYDEDGLSDESRVHDWKNHVPEEFKKGWGELTERERKLLFIIAEEAASNEEWD